MEKASDGWKKVLTFNDNNIDELRFNIVSTMKINFDDYGFIIVANGVYETHYEKIISFSYLPVYVSTKLMEELDIKTDISLYEELNDLLPIVNNIISMQGYNNISMEGITEITEEEYYKID